MSLHDAKAARARSHQHRHKTDERGSARLALVESLQLVDDEEAVRDARRRMAFVLFQVDIMVGICCRSGPKVRRRCMTAELAGAFTLLSRRR